MSEPGRLIVLYGSQTFTAQEAAERIWRTTKILGFMGPVQALDDYPITRLIQEEFAIFVVATTGQGDEPDNMKKFWKFLLRKNLPTNSLAKLKYGVLGFGDSSYTKFNFAAKKLHKRLMQLGATPLLDIGLCDYQHDLGNDAVMAPWIKDYLSKLKLFYPHIQTDNIKSTFVPRWKVSLIKDSLEIVLNGLTNDIYFDKGVKDTYLGACLLEVEKNIRTTSETHFQDVRLISLKTASDTELHYKPGDIFNIRPRNSREDIADLFSIFEEHNIDIKPHYRLLVEELHRGINRKRKYISETEIDDDLTQCTDKDDIPDTKNDDDLTQCWGEDDEDEIFQNSQVYSQTCSEENFQANKKFKDSGTCTEVVEEKRHPDEPTVIDLHGCKYFGQVVSNELLRFNINQRYIVMQKILEVLQNCGEKSEKI